MTRSKNKKKIKRRNKKTKLQVGDIVEGKGIHAPFNSQSSLNASQHSKAACTIGKKKKGKCKNKNKNTQPQVNNSVKRKRTQTRYNLRSSLNASQNSKTVKISKKKKKKRKKKTKAEENKSVEVEVIDVALNSQSNLSASQHSDATLTISKKKKGKQRKKKTELQVNKSVKRKHSQVRLNSRSSLKVGPPFNAASRVSNYESLDYCLVERKIPAKPSLPPPVLLRNAPNLELPENFNARRLEGLIGELGFHSTFFIVDRWLFKQGTVRVICMLCRESLEPYQVWEHTTSDNHALNMILPLIRKDRRKYLVWNSRESCFRCFTCGLELLRGRHLLLHFTFHHRQWSQVPQRSLSIATSMKSPNISGIVNALIKKQKQMNLYQPSDIDLFLQVARDLEWQLNVFSFKSTRKNVKIVCQVCDESFTNKWYGLTCRQVPRLVYHAKEEGHRLNVEKAKSEGTIKPWIPDFCDEHWRFLWPVPDEPVVFCTVCQVVLSNQIGAWVLHLRSIWHYINVKQLHCNLLTIESNFGENTE